MSRSTSPLGVSSRVQWMRRRGVVDGVKLYGQAGFQGDEVKSPPPVAVARAGAFGRHGELEVRGCACLFGQPVGEAAGLVAHDGHAADAPQQGPPAARRTIRVSSGSPPGALYSGSRALRRRSRGYSVCGATHIIHLSRCGTVTSVRHPSASNRIFRQSCAQHVGVNGPVRPAFAGRPLWR